MFTLTNEVGARLVTVSLQRGDLLLEGIQEAIQKTGIRDAVAVSCIVL